MKVVSIFNNKGGVGKSTLSFHLAHALSEMGVKTLMIDLDPQSNLTLQCISPEELERMWVDEAPFIDDFQSALKESGVDFNEFLKTPRSIHCLLKPIEDGVFESFNVGSIYHVNDNLGLIPGRLSLHSFEDKISKLWSDAFLGEPQALRTITSIRSICLEACEKFGYEYIIIDTSPSLGVLNKVIISMSTGFFVPCMPDMFSTVGISNIGQALNSWKGQFDTMYSLLPDKKRTSFPNSFVKFLGYTIYNAKPYAGANEYNLSMAHYSYVKKLPDVISTYIPKSCTSHLDPDVIASPIGGMAIMHSHNTLPAMAQKYRTPIWNIPTLDNLEQNDKGTIIGNRASYEEKRERYHFFANELIQRLHGLEN